MSIVNHSLTHSLTHSFTHSLTDSLTDSLTHLLTQSPDIIHNKNIDERTYLTRVNTKIDDTLLKCFDDLSKEYFTSLDSPNYWDINVCFYSLAVTCLPEMNQLRRLSLTNNKFTQSLTQLEGSITYFRKTIGQLTVIVKCKQTNTYSKHQKSQLEKFRKKFRITTLLNLQSDLYITKQKLKSKIEKLKYHKKFYERKTINRNFSCDSKSVYRTMTRSRITAEKISAKYEVETFWKNIW